MSAKPEYCDCNARDLPLNYGASKGIVAVRNSSIHTIVFHSDGIENNDNGYDDDYTNNYDDKAIMVIVMIIMMMILMMIIFILE